MKQRTSLLDPIGIGLALTIGFVVLVGILVGPRLPEVTRLNLNELGDFFAGISSTLAFIWIIVAVLLQRSELQAQRDELRQSREAFVRSADYQDAQRKIMEQELIGATADRRKREAAERAAERAALQNQLQAETRNLQALTSTKQYLDGVVSAFDDTSANNFRWPNARRLRNLQTLGRLQPPMLTSSDATSGAAFVFANNLHSFAHTVTQLVTQVEQSTHPSPHLTRVEADLDQIEPEITRRLREGRELIPPLNTQIAHQRSQVDNRRADLLSLDKRGERGID